MSLQLVFQTSTGKPSDRDILEMAQIITGIQYTLNDLHTTQQAEKEWHNSIDNINYGAGYATWQVWQQCPGANIFSTLQAQHLPNAEEGIRLAADLTGTRDTNGYITTGRTIDRSHILSILTAILSPTQAEALAPYVHHLAWGG